MTVLEQFEWGKLYFYNITMK